MTGTRPVIHLPARDIPVPRSVSPEAQAVLAMPAMDEPERPALADLDGWREVIRTHDETIGALMSARTASATVSVEERALGTFGVFDIRPDGVDDDQHVAA